MNIFQITDPEFIPYGKIICGHDVLPFISTLNSATPLPGGTEYVAEEPALQSLPAAAALGNALYGGLPVQFGWCNGHNTKLNCLEYHRGSEILLGAEDFILLLANVAELENGILNTSKVKAFRASAGILVELYGTTLHYAPCHTDPAKGFRVMVVLPKGTNTEKPDIKAVTVEDHMLWACNKWLLTHAESAEAKAGAWMGLTGPNIDIA
jgi:hypothetical protein